MIVVIYYYKFCFHRATRENTFHNNWCHPLKINSRLLLLKNEELAYPTYKFPLGFHLTDFTEDCRELQQRLFKMQWSGILSNAEKYRKGLQAIRILRARPCYATSIWREG